MVCLKTNSIKNATDEISLDNKSMQVLLFLIEHAGNKVSKEQIIAHVWKESVVNEEILAVAISKIRKALGDNARKPTYIKTLPNFGYCLIANVRILDNSTPLENAPSVKVDFKRNNHRYFVIAAVLFLVASAFFVSFTTVDREPEQLIAIDSIAVLPFEDLSEGKTNQYFSDGLSDAIINQLSQTQSLKVISRYSSFNFRGNRDPSTIGDALKVEALLDGSVQKSAGQVRVNVRIFSTFDGRLLWSKNFDSNSKDIFDLQDLISRDIQVVIQPNARPQLATAKKIDSQAYEWFLMAKYHWQQKTPTSLSKAETYLKHSLELEPNYADAHVGLATTYTHFHYYANWNQTEAVNKALPHLQQALALEPNSPSALATKGMILTLKSRFSEDPQSDLEEAKKAFLRSLEQERNATTHHWYSILLKQLGEEALVLKHMEHAIALNPLSASLKRIYSRYLAINGKLDTAQKMYERALLLEPSRDSNIVESTHVFRNTPNSIKKLAKWQSSHSELFEYCASDAYCEQVVFAYLSIGQDQEANKILARMPSKHQHFMDSLTLINHGLNGETNNAVMLLEQLSAKHPNNYKYHYSMIHAQYRAGMYEQARNSMLKLHPEWLNLPIDSAIEVTTDNYLALILYGATLLKLNDKGYANVILNHVEQFLRLNSVHDKAQAEMALAQINAQLNQPDKATTHLRKAIMLGWLETFDREWWTLHDSHLLQPIQNQTEYKILVQQHQQNVKALATQISESLESLAFDTYPEI